MPNPYAPTGPTRTASEREDPFERVIKRMGDLGADQQALANMREGWNDPDEWADLTEDGRPVSAEEGRRKWLAAFNTMTDDELRELIERAGEDEGDSTEVPLIDQLVDRLAATGELSAEDLAKVRTWYEDWHADEPAEADAEVAEALALESPDELLAWYREDEQPTGQNTEPTPVGDGAKAEPGTDDNAMPEKPVSAVLAWVGGDRWRASLALQRELARPEDDQRVTITAPLRALLEEGDGAPG